MAKTTKMKGGKILMTILVVALVIYLVYVFMQRNKTKQSESGEWHTFNWGGSQMNGTEVMFHYPNWRDKSIQQILSVGDNVEIEINGCPESWSHITNDANHLCRTKACVCRGDLSGTHQVVGLGDDSGGYMDSGFRIMANWESNNSPTPSLANGRFRKVASTTQGWW